MKVKHHIVPQNPCTTAAHSAASFCQAPGATQASLGHQQGDVILLKSHSGTAAAQGKCHFTRSMFDCLFKYGGAPT